MTDTPDGCQSVLDSSCSRALTTM